MFLLFLLHTEVNMKHTDSSVGAWACKICAEHLYFALFFVTFFTKKKVRKAEAGRRRKRILYLVREDTNHGGDVQAPLI
jgi:hypothetical protein